MNLGIPLGGLQFAAARQATTANNIANVATPGFRSAPPPPQLSAAYDTSGLPLPSDVDLNTELVNTVVNVAAYKANAAVVRVESDLQSTLLDTLG